MDCIRFESRAEIGAIIKALEEWQDTHRGDYKEETVGRLIDLLDLMGMEW